MIQGKVWGSTQCLHKGHSFEVHRIEAKAGGYCSMHKHGLKWNQFFVESGRLQIDVCRDSKGTTDTTILTAGESSSVAPDTKHMFRALEDTVAYEIYWLNDIHDDIIRYTEGGCDV